MKTLDFAQFSSDGRLLVGVTGNRIRRFSLIPNALGSFATHQTWEQKLKHCCSVAVAGRVVIATNTAGDHLGIDAESGQLLWEQRVRDLSHEGHPGLFLELDGREVFVFASWEGLLSCYDTMTGNALVANWSMGHRMARLFLSATGQLRAIVSKLPVNNHSMNTKHLIDIDLTTKTARELHDFGTQFQRIVPSTHGEMAIANEFYTPPGTESIPVSERSEKWRSHIQLLDLATFETRAMRDVPLNGLDVFSPTWSSCGEMIGLRRSGLPWRDPNNAHLILDASTLATMFEFTHPDSRRSPAFHPDGDHVVLPRGGKSPLVRLSDSNQASDRPS